MWGLTQSLHDCYHRFFNNLAKQLYKDGYRHLVANLFYKDGKHVAMGIPDEECQFSFMEIPSFYLCLLMVLTIWVKYINNSSVSCMHGCSLIILMFCFWCYPKYHYQWDIWLISIWNFLGFIWFLIMSSIIWVSMPFQFHFKLKHKMIQFEIDDVKLNQATFVDPKHLSSQLIKSNSVAMSQLSDNDRLYVLPIAISVHQFYLQISATPLGFAFNEMQKYQNNCLDIIENTNKLLKKWPNNKLYSSIWKSWHDTTKIKLNKIKRLMLILSAHPEFSKQYDHFLKFKMVQNFKSSV